MILDNRPVFMCGGTLGSVSGHAWVLDGYMEVIQQDVTRTTYSDFTEDVVIDETVLKKLLHVNWGWVGRSDGYYLSDVFDTSRRQTFDGTYDNDYSNNHNNHYEYDAFFYAIEY